ncbi:MAG: hypothetical protein JNJ54_21005 [Myxococcaceae bacterium]|nr:hypothetical protein [Myxococcaceae bacterium]
MGALTQPGTTLAVRRAGQGVLVAAGAPGHGCASGGCLGGLQVWLLTSVPRRVWELTNAPGLSLGEELGRGVAFGVTDGGFVVGVGSQRGFAVFDVDSQGLERTDGGATTSVSFGTFSFGHAFVLGQPALSRVALVDPANPGTVLMPITCAADAGLGAVVTAFDWDGDQLSDVVMSNPATNHVEVALSRRRYLCERLPVPVGGGQALTSFGQSLAGAMGSSGPVLAVGAPSSSLNFQPIAGAVAVFELCDLSSQRCADAGDDDGGPGDAGPDGGRDAGPDAGMDAGTLVDGGIVGDGGIGDGGVISDGGIDDGGVIDDGGIEDGGVIGDGGIDGGGGTDDGGVRDAGVVISDVTFVPVSCGCTAGPQLLLALTMTVFLRRRARAELRAGSPRPLA